ncbi:MAG: choice-of-anchor D domain-containing protein [Flavobacteriales bacterium]|nr:choice-of-anchor D domain-containing protein [Flavobacteriales bacterium]
MKPLIGAFLLAALACQSQTIFNESFPTDQGGISGDSIYKHEQNNRFDNDLLTFSGTGIIRSTQPSLQADYLEASGGFNIELDNNQVLVIDNIDASSFNNILLSFGVRKSTITEDGSNLTISYSSTGLNGTYAELSWKDFPTGVGTTDWYYRTTEEIPNTVTTIKFESALNDWRIDDIKLFSASPEIEVKGNNMYLSSSSSPTITDFTFFGENTINYGFTSHTFNIHNQGDIPLEISSISSSDTANFSINYNSPTTINPNKSDEFSITFKPISTGIQNTTISIQSNDTSTPIYSFDITGTGVSATICNSITESIAEQSFENQTSDNWNYSYDIADGIHIDENTNYGESGNRNATVMYDDSKSFQVNNASATLIFDAINTENYNNNTLHFNLGSYSTTAGNGADVEDIVSVYISKNNGNTWSHELQITGYDNAKWSLFSGLAVAKKSYEDNLELFKPTSGGYKLEDGYSTIVLTDLPSCSHLIVKIVIQNDFDNEFWAIDNIKLSGTKKDSRTFSSGGWDYEATNFSNAEIIIDGDYNSATSGNIEGCKCTITDSSYVTIQSGDYLSVHSDIENNGVLLVNNTASLYQVDDYGINTGNGYFRRYSTPMKEYDYTYWSSPVKNQVLENFSSGGSYYEFDPLSNNWKKATGTMNVGKGYIIRAIKGVDYSDGNVSFNGSFYGVPNNGIITQEIYNSTSKWNLVGNPYPSAIDADLLLNHASNASITNGTIYFWTHATDISNGNRGTYTTDDYASYNQTGGVAAVSGSATPTKYIGSGQSFFIEATQNGTLTFNNSMRVKNDNSQFFRSTSETQNRFWLELINNEGAYKQLLIGYIKGATNQLDRNFDGKAKEAGNHISFYSINENENLCIQGRQFPFDKKDLVRLGYSSQIEGEFQIQLAKKEGVFDQNSIILRDIAQNITHNLSLEPYTFFSTKGTFDSRFEIIFEGKEALSVETFSPVSQVNIVRHNHSIEVISETNKVKSYTIYNSLGKLLLTKKDINKNDVKIQLDSNNQLLIISFTLENNETVTKKIVH